MLGAFILTVFFVGVHAEDCEEGWTPYKVMNSCYKMTRNDTQHYWMDGSPVSQKVGKWAVEVLDKTMTRFCILKNGDGRFEQKFCTDLNKGICKRPMGQAAVKLEKPLCDEGWTGSKWTGSCYKVTPPSKSGAGQETCIGWGAKPASVLTYLEHENILEIAAAAGSHSTYLGAKRDSNGQFQWIDGSTWDYAFWSSFGRPDEFKTLNCLAASDTVEPNSHKIHRWASLDCDEVRATLCKKPGNPKPSASLHD